MRGVVCMSMYNQLMKKTKEELQKEVVNHIKAKRFDMYAVNLKNKHRVAK